MIDQTKTDTDATKNRHDDGSKGPREAAEDVAGEARSKANEVKDKVVGESKRAKDELKDHAQGFFYELKNALSDQFGRLSSALHGAERELEEQQLDGLATMPRQLADGVEDVGEYFRDRSGSELRTDFENAVAKRPVIVAGGLAVVGAAIAWSLRKDTSYPSMLAGRGSDEDASGSTGGLGGSSGHPRGSEGEGWSRRRGSA